MTGAANAAFGSAAFGNTTFETNATSTRMSDIVGPIPSSTATSKNRKIGVCRPSTEMRARRVRGLHAPLHAGRARALTVFFAGGGMVKKVRAEHAPYGSFLEGQPDETAL